MSSTGGWMIFGSFGWFIPRKNDQRCQTLESLRCWRRLVIDENHQSLNRKSRWWWRWVLSRRRMETCQSATVPRLQTTQESLPRLYIVKCVGSVLVVLVRLRLAQVVDPKERVYQEMRRSNPSYSQRQKPTRQWLSSARRQYSALFLVDNG